MDSEYEQVKKSVRAPWSLIENSPGESMRKRVAFLHGDAANLLFLLFADNFAGMSRMYGVKNVDFKQVMEYQDLPNWNE